MNGPPEKKAAPAAAKQAGAEVNTAKQAYSPQTNAQVQSKKEQVRDIVQERDVPLYQRRYILRDRDGDYVRRVISGDTETVKLLFEFTKDRAEAEQFSYKDLWSPYSNTSIGGEFTCGYGGSMAERIR